MERYRAVGRSVARSGFYIFARVFAILPQTSRARAPYASRDAHTAAQKLECIGTVHAAKMADLMKIIEKEEIKRNAFVRAKNVPEARKCVVRIHRCNTMYRKYEQLREACENLSYSVDVAQMKSDTLEIMSGVSAAFGRARDPRSEQNIARLEESLEEMKETFSMPLFNEMSPEDDAGLQELEKELAEMCELENSSEKPIAVTPPNPEAFASAEPPMQTPRPPPIPRAAPTMELPSAPNGAPPLPLAEAFNYGTGARATGKMHAT